MSKPWAALIAWLKPHIWWDKRTRTIAVQGGKMRA